MTLYKYSLKILNMSFQSTYNFVHITTLIWPHYVCHYKNFDCMVYIDIYYKKILGGHFKESYIFTIYSA